MMQILLQACSHYCCQGIWTMNLGHTPKPKAVNTPKQNGRENFVVTEQKGWCFMSIWLSMQIEKNWDWKSNTERGHGKNANTVYSLHVVLSSRLLLPTISSAAAMCQWSPSWLATEGKYLCSRESVESACPRRNPLRRRSRDALVCRSWGSMGGWVGHQTPGWWCGETLAAVNSALITS